MSTWIEEGIAALEVMKAEIDGALATLHKLKDGPASVRTPVAPKRAAVQTAPRIPRQTSTATKVVWDVHPPEATPSRATSMAEVVAERDAAILAHLKHGESTRAELVKIIPVVKDQAPDQRAAACGNAIMRLKAKRKIRQTDTGWALA